ncbi:MAG: glycosyltransferase family 4 protein [Metallibacterium sp.]
MQLSIGTPYRENAIVSIAQAAISRAQLEHFYTTLYLARWQPGVQRLPLIGPKLAKGLGRRAYAGIPTAQVTNLAILSELVHISTRRLLGSRWPALAANRMYRVKAQFDKAVARRLNKQPTDVLVGMYGASLESFRVIQQHGGMAVLNFVNSHPAEQNRYLVELAGLDAIHHEMIPAWVSARVEGELALADLVLVPSRFVAEQLLKHGVSSDKIAMLPYGVDLQAFHPQSRPESDKHAVELLYVGQISHRKGIRVLLDAARRCRELPVRFTLIGPMVSSEVFAGGLPANVTYAGASLPGGVAEAMRRADLFVLPTLEDACALVVLEAMAAALPVVTTINNGSGELIEDGRDGLIIPPGDANALVRAVTRLVEEPELRRQLGDAARQKVQSAHSWDAYGASVLQAIDARSQQLAQRGVQRA